MHTLLVEKPRSQTCQQVQQDLVGRFLKLLNEWCQQLTDLGQESPVLSVQALDGSRLQLVLRNGSRWIVQRSGKET